MRLARYTILGLLALTLGMGVAHAQDRPGRNFGSTNCQPSFPCTETGLATLAPLASKCMSGGLGKFADFSTASLDGNNCMNAQMGSNGQSSSSAVCCITPVQGQEGICSMGCSLMLYN